MGGNTASSLENQPAWRESRVWNFAAYLMDEQARKWPERIAIRCQGRSWTYAEVARLTRSMAGYYSAKGLRPGASVLIVLPDSVSFVAAHLGALYGGFISAVLTNRLRKADYAECMAAMRPALLVAAAGNEALDAAREAGLDALVLDDASLESLLQDVSADFAPVRSAGDDVCAYFVTSGTTGHPKIVPHRQEDFFAVAESLGNFFNCRKDDITLCNSRMSHAYGSFASISLPMQVGATVVLDPGKPSPTETLRLLAQERATVLFSVPAFYAMLLMHLPEASLSPSLRLCFSAGEVLPEAVFLDWREKTGITIFQGYGSTENMTFVIGRRLEDLPPTCAGTLIPPNEAVVLDSGLRPVAPGEPGQLAMRGPSVMRGYLDAPEWNARMFAPGGYLLTGDMAVERDGVYTILGRMDDMFKVGGLWASPARVESALLEHPAVSFCAVTGGTASAFSLVRAHVVVGPGWSAGPELKELLRAHALALLPDYMAPTEFVFHDTLPLTVSGKVQRYKLRQLDADGPRSGYPPTHDTEES